MTERQMIEVEEGEEVSAAVHKPKEDSDVWVFFCHGFGSNKQGSYERRCDFFAEKGYNAVRFDFRGNGESDGDFIEQNLSSRIRDLEAVIDRFEPERYILFGSSFGGKVVLEKAAVSDPEAVICRAPVTFESIMDSFRSVVDEQGRFEYIDGKPIDQSFFDDFDSYSFDESAEEIECPVAVFHGADDTTVHPENSFRAAELIGSSVLVQKLEGERHSFSDGAEEYMLEVSSSWLDAISTASRN